MLFKRKQEENSQVKILFATDVHGSDIVFKKFINAGLIYGVDAFIIGGDITGKALHPIVDLGNGRYEYEGREYSDIKPVIEEIRSKGEYYVIVSKEEYEEMKNNKKLVDEAFKRAITEVILGWDRIASEKLKDKKTPIYINLGNDDPEYLFDVLKQTENFVVTEGEVIDIKGHEMISFGYVNPTPWNTPRELPEEELYKRLETEVSKLKNVERAIFNFHAPPINTNLDNAPLLDSNLKPVIKGGMIVYTHVGSISVRKIIEKYQPLVGLHGHIHESKGFDKIGRTMVFNPGSEYDAGILHALYLVISGDKIKGHMFIIS